MAIPVAVVLDRSNVGWAGSLDLTSVIAEDSLDWSSVVPGGFGSCSFTVKGDPRRLLKQIPYLAIVRVIGDSGKILFEGQIEDLAPTVSESGMGIKVGAFGLQNALKEASVRAVWSMRDIGWVDNTTPIGTVIGGPGYISAAGGDISIGAMDPIDPLKTGVQLAGDGLTSIPNSSGYFAEYQVPSGLALTNLLGTCNALGTDAGTTSWQGTVLYLSGSTWTEATRLGAAANHIFNSVLSSPSIVRVGGVNNSGVAKVLAASDRMQFYTMRFLGTSVGEDVTDLTASETIVSGFYGDTLIRSLLSSYVPALARGLIESGSDFLIDHLDASVRRSAYDILQEVAQYYSREWAVWENAALDWKTPNLKQQQWIIPIADFSELELDASTENSRRVVIVLYTDVASGLTGEATASATDRRNPYVLANRTKDYIVTPGLPMTANTAQQFATALLNDLGFGPVPAAGTAKLPGEKIVGHAQGNAVKAWEIRAGENVTIPELPMADVFTQDGRGETLFHVVSTDANVGDGSVTLTLDSYGSKRSDVLLARLAAVTSTLGG